MHYGYTCVCLQLAFLAANTIDHDFNIFRYSGEVFGTNQLRGAESYLRREKVFSYSRNSIHIMKLEDSLRVHEIRHLSPS